MRPRTPYGTVPSTFWDGDVGSHLQAAGSSPTLLFLYLNANRHANMLGLYLVTLPSIERELRSVAGEAILPAFETLAAQQLGYYDRESEFVWVVEMLGHRLNPTKPDGGIDAGKDVKRWKAVLNMYADLPANPFLGGVL